MKCKFWYETTATALLLACAITGCGGGSDGSSAVGAPPDVERAQTACDRLKTEKIEASDISLPTNGVNITSTKLVSSDTTGEHCIVKGDILSIDKTASPIKFQVALPSAWNNKAVHIGGGGWDGIEFSADPTVPNFGEDAKFFNFSTLPKAQSRGYVTFGSDGGHEWGNDNIAAFSLNDEQLKNFAGEQLKKTRDTVMKVVALRYHAAPKLTYFLGVSGGGRQSMVVIQKYPADYDGVVSMAPVARWLPDFLKWQVIGRAMRTNGGAGWISPAKDALIYQAEVAACDDLDGAKDGIISNVAACRFDYARLQCPGGADTGDTCLSDPQIETQRIIHSETKFPFTFADGTTSAAAYQPGQWNVEGFNYGFGKEMVYPTTSLAEIGGMHYMGDAMTRFAILKDPNAKSLDFDPKNPGVHAARIQDLSKLLDATNPDIQKYIARGGKWIIYHGAADALPNVAGIENYYKEVVARFGQNEVDKMMRFYPIFGYGHGSGRFNTAGGKGGVSGLDAIENWVERGIDPDKMVFTDTNEATNGRTRPNCAFPKWPKYNGSGDINVAANFTCVTK